MASTLPSSSSSGVTATGAAAGVSVMGMKDWSRLSPLETQRLTALRQELTALVDRLAKKNGNRGAVIVRIGESSGRLLFAHASGRMVKNDASAAPSIDSPFEIQSVTKLFTAYCVQKAVRDGRLKSLDAKLVDVWPEDDKATIEGLSVVDGVDCTADITVRQLLQHRSGLADFWTDGPFVGGGKKKQGSRDNAFVAAWRKAPRRIWLPRDILLGVKRAVPAVARPGERWHYSDTGYTVLGLLLEHLNTFDADGCIEDIEPSLHSIHRRDVLLPAQCQSTWTAYREPAPSGTAAGATAAKGTAAASNSFLLPAYVCHRYEDKVDEFNVPACSADWGGGGLVSTVSDLARAAFFFAAAGTDDTAKGDGDHDASSSMAMMSLFDARPARWCTTKEDSVRYALGTFAVDFPAVGGGEQSHKETDMQRWIADRKAESQSQQGSQQQQQQQQQSQNSRQATPTTATAKGAATGAATTTTVFGHDGHNGSFLFLWPGEAQRPALALTGTFNQSEAEERCFEFFSKALPIIDRFYQKLIVVAGAAKWAM